MSFLRSLLRDRKGATAIEYCLMAVFVALALIGILQAIGAQVFGFYDQAHAGFEAGNQ